MLLDNGFALLPSISQLFLKSDENGATAMIAKIVDDFLLCGLPDVVDAIVMKLQERFEFGTATHGPGQLRF